MEKLDSKLIVRVEDAPIWAGIRTTGYHRGTPYPAMVHVGVTGYRVYFKMVNKVKTFYILRHGRPHEIDPKILEKS